jgi:hypothetical protein
MLNFLSAPQLGHLHKQLLVSGDRALCRLCIPKLIREIPSDT